MQRGGKIAAAALIASAAVLSGCVSASREDAAPVQTAPASAPAATASAPVQQEVRDNSFVEQGALRNDDFPTFEQTPRAATAQLTEEEKQALLAELNALKAAQQRGGSSAAAYNSRYRELQSIARTHGVDTQNEIEQ